MRFKFFVIQCLLVCLEEMFSASMILQEGSPDETRDWLQSHTRACNTHPVYLF